MKKQSLKVKRKMKNKNQKQHEIEWRKYFEWLLKHSNLSVPNWIYPGGKKNCKKFLKLFSEIILLLLVVVLVLLFWDFCACVVG